MRAMSDREKSEMRSRISIDFGVDPQDVARQDPMRFTAIRPTGPSVEYRTWGAVEALQRTIRKSLRGSTRMRPPPASRANSQPTIRKSLPGSNEGSPSSPSTQGKKAGKKKKTGTLHFNRSQWRGIRSARSLVPGPASGRRPLPGRMPTGPGHTSDSIQRLNRGVVHFPTT